MSFGMKIVGRLSSGGLGPQYRKILGATGLSTLGDGVFLTALPLLAAELTHDPLRVSLVDFAGSLPWLLVGLVSGALVDRWDRQRVMVVVDAVRFLIVAALTVAILTGSAGIALLAIAGFLLGVGETFFDSASPALITAALGTREADRLERANSRLLGVQTVGEELAGPPVGGFLFPLAAPVPFLLNAVSFASSAVLIACIPGRYAPERQAAPAGRRSLRREIAEGLRWLLRHRLLRTLALLVGALNLVFTAVAAVEVLFALEVLGLGSTGYGLLVTAQAVGGLLGSLLVTRLTRRLGSGGIIIPIVLVAAGCLAAAGSSSDPRTVGGLLVLVGAAITLWNVVTVSLRQAIVPDRLVGRVTGAYRMLAYGSMPIGAVAGGALARTFGLRAPFLVGAIVLVAAAALALPMVNRRSVSAARVAAAAIGS
jgi:MFS family permease